MENELPVMLLQSFIILPNQEVKLELNNELSKTVVSLAYQKSDRKLVVVCPLDQKEEQPGVSDLPVVGVVSKIVSKIILPNGNLRITLKGLNRVSIVNYQNNSQQRSILESKVNQVEIPKYNQAEEEAIKRKLLKLLKIYIDLAPHVSNSILSGLESNRSLFTLTDIITAFLPLRIEQKLGYMQEINAMHRARNLLQDLNFEIQVLKLDEQLEEKLSQSLDEAQKEYLLREKLKEIQKELQVEVDLKKEDLQEFKTKLVTLSIPDSIKTHLTKKINQYSLVAESSPEISIIRNYITTLLALPWNIYTVNETDLVKIKKSLDATHYALDEVKSRIIEYIAVLKQNPHLKSPIICLIGPPGVGKTTIAFSIAQALNKKFAKISVGGLTDAAELIGHRKTYVGASPGKIINALIKCQAANPVILIDEVDKMGLDIKGDPASALLDILDSNQNQAFVDNYIDEPFDLSQVLFILTANNEEAIPEPLKDRLELIRIAGYTEFQKLDIAHDYLLPKLLTSYRLTNEIKISLDCLRNIINGWTKEAGVRELDRLLNKIISKIITESFMKDTNQHRTLKKSDLVNYLGERKYDLKQQRKQVALGCINALASSPLGGVVSPIQTSMYEGTGKIVITGLLGDCMKESVAVALSYIKSNLTKFDIKAQYFSQKDIHLHFLAGGIPKDGPSAGLAIVSALISLFTNQRIDQTIAMTGEVSLQGDVLKVGGLQEKLVGASNRGIKKVFIPFDNQGDIAQLDDRIKAKLELIKVKNYREVYHLLFRKVKE